MSTDPVTVTILGRAHVVVLPDFATCQSILIEYGVCLNASQPVQIAWVCAGALGVTTRLGNESGADLVACRYNLLTYGKQVYNYIHKKDRKVTGNDIYELAVPVLGLINELLLKESEVKAAEDF